MNKEQFKDLGKGLMLFGIGIMFIGLSFYLSSLL